MTTRTAATRTAYRTCPLCEAGCGLEITLKQRDDGSEEVGRIRGDLDDVFSKGYICPKGSTLGALHDDPDRIRRPLVRRDGALVEVSWAEAWAEVDRRYQEVVAAHGRESVAAYVGNPNAHNLAGMLYGRAFLRSLGTPNVFSASTVDQRPKEISTGLMFGGFTVPVPDLDRTDHLLCLGANPFASNGSLATAPDWPGRLEALVARGGQLIVVDPRRTKTAEVATRWVPIRPGTDALLLAAMATVLREEGMVDTGTVGAHLEGLDEALDALAAFTPERVAPATGIDAATIRELAIGLASASSAAVYGRMGTTTQTFGTVTSWLVDVLNIATGNLDRPGGAMFTKAAAGQSNTRGTPGVGRGMRIGRRQSRVRGLPESLGELPAAALAEEIDTAGEGQVRALFTLAGNPVVSTPNAGRLDAALAGLDLLVSVDIYLNETTRHADVVLPAPSSLQKAHYDLALLQLALHNVANWSEPVLPLDEGQPDEWEVLSKLALIVGGMGPDADASVADDLTYDALAQGADPAVVEAVAATGRTGPARLVDLMLRTGPYELTLDDLLANPHGIDLGPLEPRIPEALRTPSGKIEMAPEVILADLPRLAARADEGAGTDGDDRFLLIGRRHLKSNNSWMHNVPVLMKGSHRCTMLVHPDDAAGLGLADGDLAVVTSRAGELTVPVELTDGIVPGVVSIPHGWGHGDPGVRLRVAGEHAGVNSNLLADDELLDPISGNAVLNGIPVQVRAVA